MSRFLPPSNSTNYSGIKGIYNISTYGSVGDNTTDDTQAFVSAISAVSSAGGGTVLVPVPPVSYKITQAIAVPANVSIVGLGGKATANDPIITQWASFGTNIFNCQGDHITIQNISGQYGPTTYLSGDVSIGSSSITLQSTAGILVGDWLILDQYPNLEQLQVATISGNTIGFVPPTWSNSDTYQQGVRAVYSGITYISTINSNIGHEPDTSGDWEVSGPTPTSTSYFHSSGSWVRDQTVLTGTPLFGDSRPFAGLAYFISGNCCQVLDCAVSTMVGGVFFRAIPTGNALQNYDNTVNGLITNFVQFGIILQQQTRFRIINLTYTNATGAQVSAPGHAIYATTRNNAPPTWSSGSTYIQYDQVSHSGNTYSCLAATSTNNNPSSSPSIWNNLGSNTAPSPVWSSTTTYYQGYQVDYGGNAYTCLVSTSINQEPDTNPSDWSLIGTASTSSPAWMQRCYDLTVHNIIANPGMAFLGNWAAFTFKEVVGSTLTSIVVEGADRAFNLQECTNCNFSDFVFLNFLTPVGGNEGALDVLNCNNCHFSDGIVYLFTSAGGSSNIPVVWDRTEFNGLFIADGGLDGYNNSYDSIKAYTNYDASFTQGPFQITGSRNIEFSNCKNSDSGGFNPYSYHFQQDTTMGFYTNNCVVSLPEIYGTTRGVYVVTGTTGIILNIDNNLIQSVSTWSDPGNGAVITNRYITNVGGNLGLSPQSTSNDVIHMQLPTGASLKILNFVDSGGNPEVLCSNTTGLQTRLFSSQTGNGSFLGLGFNATATNPTLNTGIGGLAFPGNGNAPSHNDAGFFAVASENQSSTAFGTNVYVRTFVPGTTTGITNQIWYGNQDTILNGTGSALVTTATGGFTYLPTMAGIPTGSPTSRTGGTPYVYDSTDGTLWVYYSARNAWVDTRALTIAGLSPANGTTFTAGSYVRVGSSQNGFSYNLPNPTLCAGSIIEIKCTNNSGLYTYAFTCPSTGATIDGVSTYYFVSNYAYTSVAFESDGTNWWIKSNIVPVYEETRPGERNLIEWAGDPAFFSNSAAPTSQTLNFYRLVVKNGGLISNILMYINSVAGVSFTAATTTTVTGTSSGAGAIVLNVSSTTGFATGNIVTISGVGGTIEANGAWEITVGTGTITLQNSTWTNAWTSGGTVTISGNCCAIYNSSGTFLTATGDQVSTWGSTGVKTMALATQITLTAGQVVYIVFLANGTTLPTFGNSGANTGFANIGLSGATLRWGSNGTSSATLPTSTTPSSNSTTNARPFWYGLS